MNVKCKICGLKGDYDSSQMSEFWATQFLYLSTSAENTTVFKQWMNQH